MGLLILTGVLVRKFDIIPEEAARAVCGFLLMLVSPIVAIYVLQQEKVPALMPGFYASLVIALVFHVLAIVVATFLIPNDGDPDFRTERMGVVFSNSGFMAFPLLAATIGQTGLLYGAAYIGIFNITLWTWGFATMSGTGRIRIRDIFINPGTIGFCIGLFLFLNGITLPPLLASFTKHIYALNTPLSMVAMGVFLYTVDVRKAVRDPMVYVVLFLRNIVTPCLLLALFAITGFAGWFPGAPDVARTMLIVAACPSATSVILMLARFGRDGQHGSEIVAASTAISPLTIPGILLLGECFL